MLTRLIGEMSAGGMAQRDLESALEKALGQFVVSKSAVSEITERLSHEYEAFRSRDLSGFDLAYLCIDTVYEPLRCWGSKTGVRCGWGICVDGRKVLLTLATAHSESYELSRGLARSGESRPPDARDEHHRRGARLAPSGRQYVAAVAAAALLVSHDAASPSESAPQAWPAFKALVADMRDAPTFEEGQRRQQAILAYSQDTFPEACRCLEDAAEASLNHLKVPARLRQYVRTSHLAERAFAEERRRTKVMPHLWDEASLVK